MESEREPLTSSDLVKTSLKDFFDRCAKKGCSSIAATVMESDLLDGHKLFVMETVIKTHAKDDDILHYRAMTKLLFIVQAIAGAVTPILIPFGQTYNGKSRVLFGIWHVSNLGEMILVVAVCWSLVGSIAMVVERAGKYSRLAYAYNNEQEQKLIAINNFIGLAGKYAEHHTLSEAYPSFVDDMGRIFAQNSRASIFGSSSGEVAESETASSKGEKRTKAKADGKGKETA